MDTFVGIIAAGRYPHSPLPVGLQDTLQEAVQKHMEAYGLRKVCVVTEQDDRKRAHATELYAVLELIEPILDFLILTVKMPPERLEAYKVLHKRVEDVLTNAGDGPLFPVRQFLAELRGEKL